MAKKKGKKGIRKPRTKRNVRFEKSQRTKPSRNFQGNIRFRGQQRKIRNNPVNENEEAELLANKERKFDLENVEKTEPLSVEEIEEINQEPEIELYTWPEFMEEAETNPEPDSTENNLLERTGLQVFKDQMEIIDRDSPIKNRHTLTERLPLISTLGTVTGVGLLAVNPFIGLPVAATSLVARPILYRLTGQKKLEEQISDQFVELAKQSLEEFDKMVDYLSEERIQDLKPNAVVLRALHKAMLYVTNIRITAINNTKCELENRREEILSKQQQPIDEKDNEELLEIGKRLKEIEEKHVPSLERRLKEIKRGKDRLSQNYKGNLATRFNIFAHRNTSSEEYLEVLKQYADAELERDTAEKDKNGIKMARAQEKMDTIMQENTGTNRFGVQNSVFNKRDGAVRIISDRRDNTVRYAGILATGITGAAITAAKLNEYAGAQEVNAAEYERMINEHNNSAVAGIQETQAELRTALGDLDQGMAQKVADEQRSIAAAYGESAALHEVNSTSSPDYFARDQLTQDHLSGITTKITERKPSGILRQLADAVRARFTPTARLDSIATQRIGNNSWEVDHTELLNTQSGALEQQKATAQLYEQLSTVLEKSEKFANTKISGINKFANNFIKVTKSFIGPIISGIATGLGIGRDMSESKKEKQHIEAAIQQEDNDRTE